jgi:predicted nucleic acid-binding protein
LRTFVDSSVWFASMVARDRNSAKAKAVLRDAAATGLVTTDHVVIETWLLLNSRHHRVAAEEFWEAIRRGIAEVEFAIPADWQAAWLVGEAFSDQKFSLVDRTSFAVMERLGLTRVASFDNDFAVYRYGRRRDRAFEVLR